jgi:membrane protein DedA with SNARE-associated domain
MIASRPASLGLSPRLVRASWALVGLLTVASLSGAAASPLLLVKAPLLLVSLAPDGRHVALLAGSLDPVLLVSLSVVRRTLFSLGVYGLGAAYGELSVRFVEARARRFGGALRALERLLARFGAPVLIVLPFLSLCVLAGAARTRFWLFLPSVVLGHCLWAGATVWLGSRFAESSQLLVDFFSERLLESTLLCFAIVLLHQIITRRKRGAVPPSN